MLTMVSTSGLVFAVFTEVYETETHVTPINGYSIERMSNGGLRVDVDDLIEGHA